MTPQRKFQHSSFVLAILDNPWNQTSKSLFMSSIDKTIPVSIVLEKNCTHCNKVFTTMQGLHTHIGKMHTAQDHKKLSCEQESLLELIRQNITGWCQQTFCVQKSAMFAFTPQSNFLAHNLNFHKMWRWWDQIQAVFWKFFYFTIRTPGYFFSLIPHPNPTWV